MLEKNGIVEKTCVQCKLQKNISCFNVRTRNKDGRENKCRDCARKYILKRCELCEIVIDELFVKNFNIKKYDNLHGFCRNCRKRLRKYQSLYGGKTCVKCNVSKSFGDFPFHKKTYDGFDSWCKECRKYYRYEVRQSLDSHVRSRLSSIKDDKRKHQCDIDLNYLINLWKGQNGKCAVSGVKMCHQRNKRQQNQFNGSVDRIDSSKGYIKGNIQWVCWNVNRMKGEHSLENLLEWCNHILNHNQIINEK